MKDRIDGFIAYIQGIRRYSPRTCEIYREVLDEYFSFSGGNLGTQAVRAYEVHLMDVRKVGPGTVNQHLSILSSFCRHLISEGVLTDNPVHKIARPKLKKRLPEFYRKKDMEEFFGSTKGTAEFGTPLSKLEHLIISILANTGIRRSELIGLNAGSVDLSRKVLLVKGKGDKMREIPLVDGLCEEISLYLSATSSLTTDAYDSDSPLLRTPGGKRLYPVFVDRTVKKELGSISGITGRKSPHVLRHTLATELLDAGTDINSIKELLGHSSLAATQVYTHNSAERLRNVYNNAHPRAKNGGKNGD